MKYILFAVLALLPVVALSACGDDDDDDDTPATATTAVATGTGDASPTEIDGGDDTATATVVPTPGACPENPDPAAADQVQIDEPSPGDASATPLHVEGLIAVFEAQFNVSIIDADGNYIVEDMPAMSSEGQTLAPFSIDVPFVVTEETFACLQVYDISNQDGTTRMDIVQVPVTLLP